MAAAEPAVIVPGFQPLVAMMSTAEVATLFTATGYEKLSAVSLNLVDRSERDYALQIEGV